MAVLSTILSDSVQFAILASVLYSLWRMIALTKEARENRRHQNAALAVVTDNVQKIEIATNSMKDALVAATAKASDLEGEKRGIAIGAGQQEAKNQP